MIWEVQFWFRAKLKKINIDKNGIVYTVLPAGYTNNLLKMKEYESRNWIGVMKNERNVF